LSRVLAQIPRTTVVALQLYSKIRRVSRDVEVGLCSTPVIACTGKASAPLVHLTLKPFDMSQTNISEPYVKGIQRHIAIRPDRSAAWAGDGQYPHSIKTIESFAVRPRWVLVRVETTGGVVGWGEATLEGHSEAVEGSLKDIARRYEYCHRIPCRAYPDQSRRLGCHEH
jgi:hypothetical protein